MENSVNTIQQNEQKLESAKTDFNKLMEEIKPFIKKSDMHIPSTSGKWVDNSACDTIISQRQNIYLNKAIKISL